jgi:hypothetical protein
MKESTLQTQCSEYLRNIDVPFHHQEKGRYANKYHSNGFPDLIFMHKGKFYMFELKTTDGIVSDKQIQTMIAWHKQGAITAVIFTFEGFIEQLKENGII